MNQASGYWANPKGSLETELQGGAPASAVPFRNLIQFGVQPLGLCGSAIRGCEIWL
jgi:hypothetical protein